MAAFCILYTKYKNIYTNCKDIYGHFAKYFFGKKGHKFNNTPKFSHFAKNSFLNLFFRIFFPSANNFIICFLVYHIGFEDFLAGRL